MLLEKYEKEGEETERYSSSNQSLWDQRYHFERMKHVLGILKLFKARGLFLDAGCGSGEYLKYMSLCGFKAVGIDISLNYLLRAKKKCGEAQVIRSSIKNLPFKQHSFNLVLCSEVLEHLIGGVDQALKELSRIINGDIIITTPIYGLIRKILGKFAKSYLEKMDESVGHISIFNINELLEKIDKKWTIKTVRTFHIVPPAMAGKLHLPPILSSLIGFVEALLNRLLSRLGNTSLIYCRKLES